MNRLGERTTQAFQSRPGGSFMSGKQTTTTKKDKETGRREHGKHQLPGGNTNHSYGGKGRQRDHTEIRLNNIDQIVQC